MKRRIPEWVWLVGVLLLLLLAHTMSYNDECMTDWECRCGENCLDTGEGDNGH